jgi:hypothetical protein
MTDTFDDWKTDALPTSPPDLPRWLTDLRDGLDAPPPTAGLARQQRLAQMERDLADCADFVVDADRYLDFLNQFEWPHERATVPRMMGRHLDDLRTRAVAKGRRLREELAILRRST